MSRSMRGLVGFGAGCLLLALAGCGTPQIGPDDEAFHAVDALYTAISLRDPAQTERCAKTLARLHDAGRLPDDAYRKLEAIINKARDDRASWETARVALRDFIKKQRG